MYLEWCLCQTQEGVLPSLLLPQYILVDVHPLRFKAQEWQKALLLPDWLITLPLTHTIFKISCISFTCRLILAYTIIWVLDFCSFSALIMWFCVCVLGWVLYSGYLKLESVWAKSVANNYLLVVLCKTENLPVLGKLPLVLIFISFRRTNVILSSFCFVH